MLRVLLAVTMAGALLPRLSCAQAQQAVAAAAPANPFFALCMDTHDSEKRTIEEQAALLKELGYDGAGHLWLDALDERLRTLDAAGLKLYQVYLRVDLTPGKEPYDKRLKDTLPSLKGRDTMLAVLMSGLKPSDTAGDPHAVAIIREIADLAAAAGIRVALYPHTNDWLERVEDGLRVVRQVERPNVGVMFNLCHWLKVDGKGDLKALLASAMPHLFAVSLHGADSAAAIHDGTGNWIQPLGSGSFDVGALLATLRELGYRGPISLQCYGIPGDARVHLSQSIAAWREMATPTSNLR